MVDFSKVQKPCPLRQFNNIEAQAAIFNDRIHDGITAKARAQLYKDTNGISARPLIRIPMTNVVPPPLHIITGIGNALINLIEKEEDEEGQKNLQNLFNSIGVSREAFRKKDFCGNHLKKILEHADEVADCFLYSPTADDLNTMFKNLAEIQSLCKVN